VPAKIAAMIAAVIAAMPMRRMTVLVTQARTRPHFCDLPVRLKRRVQGQSSTVWLTNPSAAGFACRSSNYG